MKRAARGEAPHQALRAQARPLRQGLGREGRGGRYVLDRRRRDVRRSWANPAAARARRGAASCASSNRRLVKCGSRARTCWVSHASEMRRAPARHADRLPGPVLVAEPAHARGRDRRGAAGDPRLGSTDERARARGGALRARGAGAHAPAALPARVQRRPAPAHRHRARARAEPGARDRGRSRVGARRLDSSAGGRSCCWTCRCG